MILFGEVGKPIVRPPPPRECVAILGREERESQPLRPRKTLTSQFRNTDTRHDGGGTGSGETALCDALAGRGRMGRRRERGKRSERCCESAQHPQRVRRRGSPGEVNAFPRYSPHDISQAPTWSKTIGSTRNTTRTTFLFFFPVFCLFVCLATFFFLLYLVVGYSCPASKYF